MQEELGPAMGLPPQAARFRVKKRMESAGEEEEEEEKGGGLFRLGKKVR